MSPRDGPRRVIAVDWSGAAIGAERKIWLAEARSGRLLRLENGRSREQLLDHLAAESALDPLLVVGLDFAFSVPAWLLAAWGLADAPALWAHLERHAEELLAACRSPFWGRPGTRRPSLPAHHRQTEWRLPPVGGIRPKSVFQVGGAGAVGTGALRGMALLRRLQRAGFAIWPYDPPRCPLVVEIYPRQLTGAVVKSSAAARAVYLAALPDTLPPPLRARAEGSEDAFDAAVSALVMARHVDRLAALPALHDPVARLEGQIWHPRWQDDACRSSRLSELRAWKRRQVGPEGFAQR
jgi:hypothetical protein